jgi:hypothetical protein
MTTKILSGTYNSGYTLKSGYQAVSITSTGRLNGAAGATGYYSFGVGGQGGMGGDALTLVTSASAFNRGQLTGGAGGQGGYGYNIGGYGGYGGAGVALTNGGQLANFGKITGGAGGYGGFSGYGVYSLGYGGQGGVGGAGVYLNGASHLTNAGTIRGGKGGGGGGGAFLDGIGGYGGAGVVARTAVTLGNTGTILGGAGGAAHPRPGILAALNIAGDGVDMRAGGRVTNGSAASHTALIEGYAAVYAGPGGAATVTNFGTLDGTSGVAVDFRSASDRLIVENGSVLIGSAQGGGGTVELAGGAGTITGLGGVASLSGAASGQLSGFGTYVIDGGASWTLMGASKLDAGETLDVMNGGTAVVSGALTNAGLIALMSTGTATDLVVGAAGAKLFGGGQVTLSNNAANAIIGLTGAATLTNVNDTISGAGQIGEGRMRLVNAKGGTIIGGQTTALVIDTGANAISNLGLIENKGKGGTLVVSAVRNSGTLLAAGSGTLILQGLVTGTGVGQVNGGRLFVQQAFKENVAFTGTTGVLELGDSVAYTGQVSGFSKTSKTSFDLADIGFHDIHQASYAGTASGGVLTVTDGTRTAHINLVGDYTSLFFVTLNDGHGGTLVRDLTSPPPTTAAVLSQSIAAMGGGSSAAMVGVASADMTRTPMLLAAR